MQHHELTVEITHEKASTELQIPRYRHTTCCYPAARMRIYMRVYELYIYM